MAIASYSGIAKKGDRGLSNPHKTLSPQKSTAGKFQNEKYVRVYDDSTFEPP